MIVIVMVVVMMMISGASVATMVLLEVFKGSEMIIFNMVVDMLVLEFVPCTD